MSNALAKIMEVAVIALAAFLIAWVAYSVSVVYAPAPLDTSRCEVVATEPVKILICPYQEGAQ